MFTITMQNHAHTKTDSASTTPDSKSNNNGSLSDEKMRISGNEILLIADVANGTPYSPWNGSIMSASYLNAFRHEIQDAEEYAKVGDKWDVSIGELLLKFDRMPATAKVELFNHVTEAWSLHKDDFFDFLISRRFLFSPLRENEDNKSYLIAPRLASGEIVVNREQSPPKPCDFEAILHALRRVSSNNRQFIHKEVTFPEEVGFTTCVETGANDDIVFAQLKGRNNLTRFVRGRTPQRSKSVFVDLKRESAQKYLLINGFVGCKRVLEPWDSLTFERKPNWPMISSAHARAFWAGHALVWDEKSIVPGTETTTTPACF